MQSNKRKALINKIISGRSKRLAGHIYTIFWKIQDWTTKKWTEDGWSDINSDHIKLISFLADEQGNSNNELAKHAGVTKQAMSQMVTLLEKRGVVNVQSNPTDSRAKLIFLSDYGFEFLAYLGASTDELMKEFTEIIGPEKMKIITDISLELADGIMKKQTILNRK